MRKNEEYELDGKKFSLPFSVTQSEQGDLFAFYKGKDRGLGAGAYGSVKLAQNLSSGNWAAIKIQRHKKSTMI